MENNLERTIGPKELEALLDYERLKALLDYEGEDRRTEALPEFVLPMVTGSIDAFGNAGIGLIAKFGTCSDCGRANKVVGPKDDPPETRTCYGGCENQKGLTQWERKVAATGIDPRFLRELAAHERYVKAVAELEAMKEEVDNDG